MSSNRTFQDDINYSWETLSRAKKEGEKIFNKITRKTGLCLSRIWYASLETSLNFLLDYRREILAYLCRNTFSEEMRRKNSYFSRLPQNFYTRDPFGANTKPNEISKRTAKGFEKGLGLGIKIGRGKRKYFRVRSRKSGFETSSSLP